ncbi:hypothetical protein [Clostridium luticellarii]|uniref:Uncharacterized protein n=1 Tax=Clostridium luticellarii TaxID=1691940 RepID=A0A2T0BPG1_9CLOT|nr:hypothetical protein [Clostridium luticellarii]PRR85712.1 hypothetical protein CLLU_13380 [Clostridium luticellarii]
MLGINWIELFLRGIPEMFLVIWGIHIIARKNINLKSYIISVAVMSLLSSLVKMLPIYFGVHTMLIIILTICIMASIGISIITSIYATLFIFLILSVSEFLNMALLDLLKININFTDSIKKSLLGIPSLLISFLLILLLQHLLKKRGSKNVSN